MLRLITKKRGRDKVLTMAELDDIRYKFFDKGKNISQINRETGHARQTIRNAISQKTFQFKPISKKLSVTKLAPYYEIIDKWLIEDKQFKKKQRHTAQRVYNRLVELYTYRHDNYPNIGGILQTLISHRDPDCIAKSLYNSIKDTYIKHGYLNFLIDQKT
jgi:hypothetical protein